MNEKSLQEIEEAGIEEGVLTITHIDGTTTKVPVYRFAGETMTQAITRTLKEYNYTAEA